MACTSCTDRDWLEDLLESDAFTVSIDDGEGDPSTFRLTWGSLLGLLGVLLILWHIRRES